jgi:eukaryotic-like serine/threonine-protein kinase
MRFTRGARLCAGLTHPTIATVHDFGEAPLTPGRYGDLAAFRVKWVDGEPLSAVLGRAGRLTPDGTLQIVRQTAAGLAAAHASCSAYSRVAPGAGASAPPRPGSNGGVAVRKSAA